MSFWHDQIIIGNLKFPRFIGGPLDGITDAPFRRLVRQFSTEEPLYTEMRHVACITHEKGGTRALNFDPLERPLNYQVAANKIDFIPQAIERILAKGIDMLDLNIGCPTRNVTQSGSGSALMADLPRLKNILLLFRSLLPIPFTIKIRAGFKCKNGIEVAQLAQDCGVDAIAIHPRLQTQKFEGRPDYAYAADIKKSVSIPVIISGGVINWTTARLVHEMTGVDGFLIGRGMWSKPWKLLELREHSQGRSFNVDSSIIVQCAHVHLDEMIAYYGHQGLYNFRKHLPFYIQRVHNASQVRVNLVGSTSVDAVKEGLMHAFHGAV